ncbi:FrpA [Neisseria meningitidis]|uniref:FrpA n=1 Tax=Neisseria meningitidis TaxID=487 RepID=UPI0022A8DBF2|nr:FrpA [Neisseria meningitidis]MCZ2346355.1 FrpA [Neisseria meningitidis]
MENNKAKSDDNSVSIEFIQDFITASTDVINLSYENFRKNFYTQMSTDSTNYAAKHESLGKSLQRELQKTQSQLRQVVRKMQSKYNINNKARAAEISLLRQMQSQFSRKDVNKNLGNGNTLAQQGSYTKKDGTTAQAGDLLLAADNLHSRLTDKMLSISHVRENTISPFVLGCLKQITINAYHYLK